MDTAKPSHKLNPISGFTYFLSGFLLITRKGIRAWVLIPLGINVLLFGALIYASFTQIDAVTAQFEQWLPDWLEWLSWLLWPIFMASVALVVFFTFALLVNIIAAPFNGPLSAAVEKHLTGKAPPCIQPEGHFLVRFLSGLGEEVHRQLYNLSRLIPVLILFLIPGIQLAAPFLMLLLTAWLFALQYADYPMGNHGLSFKKQRELMRGRRLLSLSFGATTLGATLIPGLNMLAMPVAVAGVTKLWLKEFPEQDR